jgi:hypothetical protein
MNRFRESIIFRLFWLLFALHILNFSVDTADQHPDYIAEDLTLNDLESYIEIFLEIVLGIEDAIPEHDEPDDKNGKQNLQSGFDLFFHHVLIALPAPHTRSRKQNLPIEYCPAQFDPQLVAPPPKLA